MRALRGCETEPREMHASALNIMRDGGRGKQRLRCLKCLVSPGEEKRSNLSKWLTIQSDLYGPRWKILVLWVW